MAAVPLSLTLYRLMMNALQLALPYYLRKRARDGKEDFARLDERRGKAYPPRAPAKTTIWLHAVSVGEANAALSLAASFDKIYEDCHFIITTGTLTAGGMVTHHGTPLSITHIYAPFDAPAIIKRFFDYIDADFGVIFESDFWPNMLMGASEAGIPLYLASAQMSQSSFASWSKRPAFAKAVFSHIAHCYAVDELQKQQFEALGIAAVSVTGSLKLPGIKPVDNTLIKSLQNAGGKRPIILAASTHHTEEQIALQISEYLHIKNQDHLMIIAPRHPERGDEVAALMGNVKRRSEGQLPEAGDRYYLADSLGDMASLYQACNIAILGATYSGKGGHNPLEAASFGKALICGPSQFKNQFEFDALKEKGVIFQLSDNTQIAQTILQLLDNKKELAKIARAGKAYVKKAEKRADDVAGQIAKANKARSS